VWLKIDGAGGERLWKKNQKGGTESRRRPRDNSSLLRDQCLKTGMAVTRTPIGPPNWAVSTAGLVFALRVFTALTSDE
jgi:hypothetical protein